MRNLTAICAIGAVALVVGACSSSPSDITGESTAAASAGQVFNFGAIAHSGSCLDATGAGTGDGTQIEEWTCNGSGAQSFELTDAGGGAFAIVNTHANKCVDVNAQGTANGTKIQLWDCNQSPAQSFYLDDAGGGFVTIVNTHSNKCLDVSGDSPNDGTVVQLYDCNGTNAQKWNPTVIGTATTGGGGSTGGSCDAAQLAHCNCPNGYSCCPTDGSCFQAASQVVYTMCKDDPASACTMGGTSSSPPVTPPSNPPSNPGGARDFAFVNKCGYDIWVGGEGNPVNPPVACSAGCPSGSACNTANQLCTWSVPSLGSVELTPGQSETMTVPPSWGGRFWPRTECTTANGRTTCATGDCAGNLVCPVGVGGAPPATLAEFTVMPPSAGSDFYDISNVDGANVPVEIAPIGGTYNTNPPAGTNLTYYCQSPGSPNASGSLQGCPWNIEGSCPGELQDQDPGHYVGCRSAGQVCAVDPSSSALNCGGEVDLYRCNGGGPNDVSGSCYSDGANASCCGCPSWSPSGACKSSNSRWTSGPAGHYAQVFKDMCPTAYSFPYDDLTSTFTCLGSASANTGYTITFCP